MTAPRDLTDHLAGAECSDVEVGQMWRSMAPRLAPRLRSRWRMALAASAVAVAVVAGLGVALRPRFPVAAVPGTTVETATGGEAFVLGDGSVVRIGARSRVRVAQVRPDAVGIVLERGAAELVVTRAPQRRFSVSVGRIVVAVIGTKFKVTVGNGVGGAPRPVRVEVTQGVVEVRVPGREALSLVAGEVWSGVDAPPDRPAVAALPAPSGKSGSTAAPAPGPEPAETPPALVPAPARPAARAMTTPPRAPTRARAGTDAPVLLFQEADRAWVQGRPAEAARKFEEVRRRFPSDAVAPMAALQLGRIRLDALDDPRGALEALASASRGIRDPALREDIDARIVEGWARAGDAAACSQARSRYLARYPAGHHREAVARLCPGR